MEHKVASLVFALHETNDKCQWWGTTWEKDPEAKSGMKLLPCGEPTVGTGLFCSMTHDLDEVIDVCERHAATAKYWNED